MSQHTPGPWTMIVYPKDSATVTTENSAPKQGVIATMSADSVAIPLTERIANARLIAAAPEMYNLLRAFLDGQWQPIKKARALLAKIEGK